MVENLLTHIKNKQDPKYQSVEFPSVLDQIKTDDAEFELSISNTIAKLQLYHRSSKYKHDFSNNVEKSIGLVFVNTTTKDLPYVEKQEKLDKRLKTALGRMKTFWRVDELKVVRDPTKEEVREKFDWVKEKIKNFNENKSEDEVLAVVVRWMGWDVELGRKTHTVEREIKINKQQ